MKNMCTKVREVSLELFSLGAMIMFACGRPKWKSPCVCRLHVKQFLISSTQTANVMQLNESAFFWYIEKCVKEKVYSCALVMSFEKLYLIWERSLQQSWNYIHCWWDTREEKNKICSLLIWNLFRNLFKVHTHKLHRIGNEVYSSKLWINFGLRRTLENGIVCCILGA